MINCFFEKIKYKDHQWHIRAILGCWHLIRNAVRVYQLLPLALRVG